MDTLYVFTDGSSLGNSSTSPGGAAIYIPAIKFLWSKSLTGTNNVAELEAIGMALWYVWKRHNKLDIPNGSVTLVSDSRYVIGVVFGSNKVTANKSKVESCRRLIRLITDLGITVSVKHVDAHTKNTDFMSVNNAIVDKEARRRATEIRLTGSQDSPNQ